MGLTIETWNIAFRKRKSNLIFDNCDDFVLIKNDMHGWYADPFLFDYNGETYLFAEYYSYKLKKGIIRYSKYNKNQECFDKFSTIIEESYHLSYPCVFKYKNNIYMMPESGESGSLYFYKAEHFPDKWVKLSPLMTDVRLADTTPIIKGDDLFALTLKQDVGNAANGSLCLLKFNKDSFDFVSEEPITSDMSLARPGGKCFVFNNKLYRVAQNCSEEYGKSISLFAVEDDFENHYSESLHCKVSADKVKLLNAGKPDGIHTYNFSEKLEVIDLKYYKKSYYRAFTALKEKITNH